MSAQSAIKSLSSILTTIPTTDNPASTLLDDVRVTSQISKLLRQPNSGAGDNNLCRWFYDTFQTSDQDLQLVVLRYLPIIVGLYLSRVPLRRPQAGFEAVLLALYAHETNARNGQAVTVNVPDLSHPSVYHETKAPTKNNATDLNLAIISPGLEPYGTVRSTKRARIVGVALELYYSKISQMPLGSKLEFCEFAEKWAGQDGEMYKEDGAKSVKKEIKDKEEVGRVPLPWDLLQPVLSILGHCLLGAKKNNELYDAASIACRCLYARSLHDTDPKAILATGSLLRLIKIGLDSVKETDHTEIVISDNLISL